jgi:hypothetical protein
MDSIRNDQIISQSYGDEHTKTEMLASSIMLLSINEEAPASKVGYRSCFDSSATTNCPERRGSLSGWGCLKTRVTYKANLCSLAGPEPSSNSYQQDSKVSSNAYFSEDSWGYFFDEDTAAPRR